MSLDPCDECGSANLRQIALGAFPGYKFCSMPCSSAGERRLDKGLMPTFLQEAKDAT